MKNMNPWHDSYALNETHYDACCVDAKEKAKAETWLKEDSADAWLHMRFLQCADPLLECYPGARWLTVGDGRFGKDAHYLMTRKADVLATDISDVLLKKGKESGFIKEYRKENAEHLSFEDQSFDFVLCKESYHHFPRPMLALYEMIRVARKGVILVEPMEAPVLLALRGVFLKAIKEMMIHAGLGALLGSRETGIIENGGDDFETGGNYVFSISEREISKTALGIGLTNVAFKGLNTWYVEGAEFEKADDTSAIFRKIKAEIEQRDRRCRKGLSRAHHDLLAAIIMKETFSPQLKTALVAHGYRVVDLPRNPYAGKRPVRSET